MNFKKIATITMAALLAISSSMPASAVTKTGAYIMHKVHQPPLVYLILGN